jgi:hypothetical protein
VLVGAPLASLWCDSAKIGEKIFIFRCKFFFFVALSTKITVLRNVTSSSVVDRCRPYTVTWSKVILVIHSLRL